MNLAPTARVLLDETVRLEVGKEYFVRGRVVGDIGGEDMIFTPCGEKLADRDVLGAHAIVKCEDGKCPVRIMYLGSESRIIYKDTWLGYLEDLSEDNQRRRKLRTLQQGNMGPISADVFSRAMENMTEGDRDRFRGILADFPDVFSTHKFDLGETRHAVHHIDTGDARPISCNPRRIPLGVEEKVDALVEQLLQHNIIRPSQSPWNSPIVVVAKKNGDIRMCVDFRRLNAVTQRPIFPIPDAHQLFDALDGANVFSTLDLSQGYHQVPVAEEDILKTAFTTRKGQFEYLRMPFGLCSAPATFQRLMHTVLKTENWIKCLIYLDDVLIFGRTAEEHLERLRAVLQRMREAGLKLSPEKCHFFQQKVEYLGHVISGEGIRTSPDKIDKVRNWPSPVNAENLRSFLGLSGYYRRFIRGYAEIVAPLEKLCMGTAKKKGAHQVEWLWTAEHEEIFQKLKWCLTHAPVLAFPTSTGRFILDTDASHDAIGAVLSQEQDGEERVIAYASHKFSKCERAYCITRKELLAVYKYVRHFKHYLYGRRFVIRTDHQSLTWMMNWRKPSSSQYCSWIAELEAYDFEICHRPGRLHGNADALSRIPQCEQCELRHIDPQKRRNTKDLNKPDSADRVICKLAKASNSWDQTKDMDLRLILNLLKGGQVGDAYPKALEGGSSTVRTLWQRRHELRIRGGLLYLLGAQGNYALVVPKERRRNLISVTHHTLGHVGTRKTLDVLREEYYWPNMEGDVRVHVQGCRPCAERKCVAVQLPRLTTVTGFPFEKIALDITGPLPPAPNGYRYILGVIDYFSKFPMLIPLKTADARSVADVLFKRWISVFGVPWSIHSDRGTCFESELFKELCQIMGIKKTRSAPYYPQSDGLVERLFRTVKDMIYATTKTYRKDWRSVLPVVELGLRSTVSATTGFTPYQVVFGRTMRLPLTWMDDQLRPGAANPKGRSYSAFIMELESRMEKVHSTLKDQYLRAKTKLANSPERGSRCYNVGELVMARIFPKAKGMMEPRFNGPYRIVKKLGPWTYELRNESDGAIVHRNHHHVKHLCARGEV